jgi:hypothetical protein
MAKDKAVARPSLALHGNDGVIGVTGDVVRNVDFRSRITGLQVIKTTRNFDASLRNNTRSSDAGGGHGSDVTDLELNDVPMSPPGRGNHFAAMLRVRSNTAQDCWQDRMAQNKVLSEPIRRNPTEACRPVSKDVKDRHIAQTVADAIVAPQPFPTRSLQEFVIGVRQHLAIDCDDPRYGQRSVANARPIPTTPVRVIELCNIPPGLAFDQKPDWRPALARQGDPPRRRVQNALHNPRHPDGRFTSKLADAPLHTA